MARSFATIQSLLAGLTILTATILFVMPVSAQTKNVMRPIIVDGKSIAPPPAKPGCYSYRGAWKEIPCASKDYVRKQFPRPDGSLTVATLPPADSQPIFYLDYIQSVFTVSKFGSETDTPYGPGNSTHGPGKWTAQINSNSFTGTNGHNDWVQFVQYSSGHGNYGFCVWNIDFTTKDYYTNTSCLAPPSPNPNATLSTGAKIYYQIVLNGLLTFTAFDQHNVGWAVISQDVFGLENNLSVITSGLFGYSSSQAVFTNTCMTNTLEIEIPSPSLDSNLQAVLGSQPPGGVVTLESNNLTNAKSSTISCTGTSCVATAYLETSGAGCYKPKPKPPAAVCTASIDCSAEVSISCTGEDVGVKLNGNCKDKDGKPIECVAGFTGDSAVSVKGNPDWVGSTSGTNITACTKAKDGTENCQTVVAHLPGKNLCPGSTGPPANPCAPGLWCTKLDRCLSQEQYKTLCLVAPPTR